MDFSHILKTSIPRKEKLVSFGFIKEGKKYCLKQLLDKDFSVQVIITGTQINADVTETATGEKYVILDMEETKGSFVNSIREKVTDLVENIRQECFVTTDLTATYIAWIEKEFGVKGEFPWKIYPDYEVFRCPNKKWFALVGHITFKNLGLQSDEKVYVVNLKSDAIPKVVDNTSVFPAWHMNKKSWITVLLTTVTDFDTLCSLTRQSYQLVQGI